MSTESPRFILRKRIIPKSQVQPPKGSTSPKSSSSSSSSSSNVEVDKSSHHESELSVESSINVSTTASSCETSVSTLSSSLQSLSIKKSVKLDRISEQLNKFVLDSNKASIEKVWYLSQSNKGGFKLVSCGFAYTVDKPKLHVIKSGQASTISWKCDTLGCKGRGKSNGLNPPFSITVAHDIHTPSVEKLTQVKMKNEVREKALTLNDVPRTIIASSQKHLSREEIWSLSRPDAYRQFINRTRNKKYKVKCKLIL